MSNRYQELYGLNYFGLLMTFNFHDENLPIAFSKKKNLYYRFSIADFRKFLKHNNTVKFHQEGHTNSMRSPDCDGFISLTHRFNVNSFCQRKRPRYKDLLESIIQEEWGGFNLQQDNLLSKGRVFDIPYMVI